MSPDTLRLLFERALISTVVIAVLLSFVVAARLVTALVVAWRFYRSTFWSGFWRRFTGI